MAKPSRNDASKTSSGPATVSAKQGARSRRADVLPQPSPQAPRAPSTAPAPGGFMETLLAAKEASKRHPPAFLTKASLLLAHVALIGLAVIPAWFTVNLVATYAVNTPFGDDWKLVDHLESLNHDHLSWRDICRPVDGERSPLPQLLHLGALRITGGDVRVDAWMNLAWISLTSVGILLLLLRTIKGDFAIALLYLIANLALFSPAQNLFSTRQAGILIPVACLVWAHLFASFHFSSVIKFSACVLLSLIAAACGIYGLALLGTVPILACFAVGLPCRIRPIVFAAAWGIFAVITLRIYFWDWNPFGGLFTAVPEGIETSPRLERGFAIAFRILSSPLIEGWGWAGPLARAALGTGLTGMLLGMAAWTLTSTMGHHRPLSGVRCSPWLLLGMSGLTGVGLVALDRLAVSPFAAPVPSPSSINLGSAAFPVLLGTLVPFYVLVREWIHGIRPFVLRILPALLLASVFGSVIGLQSESWFRGQEAIRLEHHQRLRARVALHLSNLFPPADPVAFGTDDAAILSRRARFLHDSGYLTPLLLHEPVWPGRRVDPQPLSLLEARVDESTGFQPPNLRVIARMPSASGKLEPLAGVLLTTEDAFDPNQHHLLARATPDPSDLAGWFIELPPGEINSPRIDIWAIDGQTMIAHPLDQYLFHLDGEPGFSLRRSSLPPPEPLHPLRTE